MYHHYLVAVGDGEITRNWFRPLCQPHTKGRPIPVDKRTDVRPSTDACPDCTAILEAIDEAQRRHPAGRRIAQ
jgi:hypothetical protein